MGCWRRLGLAARSNAGKTSHRACARSISSIDLGGRRDASCSAKGEEMRAEISQREPDLDDRTDRWYCRCVLSHLADPNSIRQLALVSLQFRGQVASVFQTTQLSVLGRSRHCLDELQRLFKLTALGLWIRSNSDRSIGRPRSRILHRPGLRSGTLLETKDEKGRPVRFGSVGGGGRYDGLVSRFRGQPVPATGFSIGVSRLQAALTMIGKLDTKPAPGPVLVTMFRDGAIADYQKLVTL